MTIEIKRPDGAAAFGIEFEGTGEMGVELPGLHTRTPTFEIYVDSDPSAEAVVNFWGTVSGLAWTLLCTLSASGANGVDSATPKINIAYTRYKATVTSNVTKVSAWMGV